MGIIVVDNTTESTTRKLRIFIPTPAQPSVKPVQCWRFIQTHSVTSAVLVKHLDVLVGFRVDSGRPETRLKYISPEHGMPYSLLSFQVYRNPQPRVWEVLSLVTKSFSDYHV